MASLERRNGTYRVIFRYGGQKFSRSLRTSRQQTARAHVARLEDNLHRLELGVLDLPVGEDVASFLLSGGKPNGKPRMPAVRSLEQLCKAFTESVPQDAIEESTLSTMLIQMRHLQRILGKKQDVRRVELADLQRYVDQRSGEQGRYGRPISVVTIKKELSTFRTIWKWGEQTGVVDRPFPNRGLRYPKTTEKSPFQTWQEINRKVSRGGLSDAAQEELWESLFLTVGEIQELLDHVKLVARHPFIYPMFVFAAHTGARRSEMMRSTIDDVDLVASVVTIREKKRARGKLTTRRVPISPELLTVMNDWLDNHPGGQFTFCHTAQSRHSESQGSVPTALTRDQAHHYFQQTLAGSKWNKVRGWHVFRHSFCSNCAAAGIDQRMIDAWMGHQTDDMRRRYRHLFPDQQREAIGLVFGGRGE